MKKIFLFIFSIVCAYCVNAQTLSLKHKIRENKIYERQLPTPAIINLNGGGTIYGYLKEINQSSIVLRIPTSPKQKKYNSTLRKK